MHSHNAPSLSWFIQPPASLMPIILRNSRAKSDLPRHTAPAMDDLDTMSASIPAIRVLVDRDRRVLLGMCASELAPGRRWQQRRDVCDAQELLGMVCGLLFLVIVEIMSSCMRPLLFCEQVMDSLMVLLLIASIVLAVSDVFQHCSTHHLKLRCLDINVGVSFTFVPLAAFLATLVLSCFADCEDNGCDLAVYDDEISPLSYEYDPTLVAVATPLTATATLVKV
ncbi:hypothetical protein FI667_g2914, partial [Globisporangium splendens]